jgi:cell division protein FtsB
MIRRLLFPLLLGVSGYYALFGGAHSFSQYRAIQQERVRLTGALSDLRQEVDSLRTRVEALEDDPRALEAIARERFGLIRPGELLYRFADAEEPAPE